MITTLGASAGAVASHWGGNGTSEGRTLVTFSGLGSAIGSLERSRIVLDLWFCAACANDAVERIKIPPPTAICWDRRVIRDRPGMFLGNEQLLDQCSFVLGELPKTSWFDFTFQDTVAVQWGSVVFQSDR